MDSDAKDIIRQAGAMFDGRFPLLSLWQTISENFYVIRADFTRQRNLGEEFAANLLSSYPLLAHRELMGIMSSMLRRDKWFSLSTGGHQEPSNQARRWMERTTDIQRKAMYARSAGFNKAAKEGDGDFVAFGQAVLSVEMNKYRDGLLYRCWHLRDVAWHEDEQGQISNIARKWKPQAVDLVKMFPDKVSQKTREIASKTPFEKIECYHVVSPASDHSDGQYGDMPWVSTFIEIADQNILEQKGLYNKMYVIPRWQTISGSQYAYSPATVAALPDARLIQAMTNTLLEAGEKFTNPPLVGVEGMIRSDVQVYAGGITWVDAEYDERLGEVLRPMSQNSGGMPIGFNMQEDIRKQIAEAFYLNKMNLPDVRQMTAYEVSERMQELVRQTLPLFEPMEQEYNGQLCDITFDLMRRNGDFGSDFDIPRELKGESIEFQFESPISKADDKQKGQLFAQLSDMLAAASEMDPGTIQDVDVSTAFREALAGVGVPSTWIVPEKDADQAKALEQVKEMAMMATQAEGAA
jgi:hypothetical protein